MVIVRRQSWLISLPSSESCSHIKEATLALEKGDSQSLVEDNLLKGFCWKVSNLTLRGHVVCLKTLKRCFLVLDAALALEEAALEVNTEAVTGSVAGYLSLLF